jgi:hypothetical protein
MIRKRLVVLVTVLLVGCTTISNYPESNVQPNVVISDNWEYLALSEMYGDPNQNATAIGHAIKMWEDEHPDRVIIDLDILFMGSSYGGFPAQVYGISIYSQPTGSP